LPSRKERKSCLMSMF